MSTHGTALTDQEAPPRAEVAAGRLPLPQGRAARPVTPTARPWVAGSGQQASGAIVVQIEHLRDNPYQPRLAFRDEDLADLILSIQQFGFVSVLVARRDPLDAGRYELAFGHRRLRAASLAGLKAVPVLVRELTDKQMRSIAFAENQARLALTDWEVALHYKALQDDGMSMAEIAEAVGKSKGYVQHRLDLLRIEDPELRAAAEAGEYPMTLFSTLVYLEPGEQRRIFEEVRAGRLTTDGVKQLIRARVRAEKGHQRQAELTAQGHDADLAFAREHGVTGRVHHVDLPPTPAPVPPPSAAPVAASDPAAPAEATHPATTATGLRRPVWQEEDAALPGDDAPWDEAMEAQVERLAEEGPHHAGLASHLAATMPALPPAGTAPSRELVAAHDRTLFGAPEKLAERAAKGNAHLVWQLESFAAAYRKNREQADLSRLEPLQVERIHAALADIKALIADTYHALHAGHS